MSDAISKNIEKELFANAKSFKRRVVLLLLVDAGLRPFELVQLQSQHISFSENKIHINNDGKVLPFLSKMEATSRIFGHLNPRVGKKLFKNKSPFISTR